MKSIKLILNLLILNKEAKYKVLFLFYYYYYLNKINLIDLSYINLITY